MSPKSYAERAKKRLAHVKAHLAFGFDIPELVNNVEKKKGNPRASTMSLSEHAGACAMVAWFENRNLDEFRQWVYVAARLDQLWYQMEEDKSGPGAKMLELRRPLASNNHALIEWFTHFDAAYDLSRVENPATHDFFAYQAVLALRGEWKILEERCNRILSSPPNDEDEQRYLLDHRFYLALAKGNMSRMEEVLQQLVTPKVMQSRSNETTGFTEDLIFIPAVNYSKIAWRSGYQVKIDSSYVPAEWLAMEPLPKYDAHYNFLK